MKKGLFRLVIAIVISLLGITVSFCYAWFTTLEKSKVDGLTFQLIEDIEGNVEIDAEEGDASKGVLYFGTRLNYKIRMLRDIKNLRIIGQSTIPTYGEFRAYFEGRENLLLGTYYKCFKDGDSVSKYVYDIQKDESVDKIEFLFNFLINNDVFNAINIYLEDQLLNYYFDGTTSYYSLNDPDLVFNKDVEYSLSVSIGEGDFSPTYQKEDELYYYLTNSLNCFLLSSFNLSFDSTII